MSRNPGPYTPPKIEESIHPCEGLGTKYLLPWRLLDCFRTCMEEVRRRPEAGRAVHELFKAYQDREVYPRYEGRFAPIEAARWLGTYHLMIYDMDETLHKHLAELQRRARELGADFCLNSPEAQRGWITGLDGQRDIDLETCHKLDDLVCEIGDRDE